MSYSDFLARKSQYAEDSGFEPLWMPEFLFDFQRSLVEWAIRRGRSAIFADCGLGKTPMQLVWAQNVVRKTNKPVLIVTPLAVSYQTIAEAAKFGIDAGRSTGGRFTRARSIFVTNYERLHHFNPTDFAGMVCDESSILKNFDGARKALVTEFMRQMPYRLLCTATAAPNDYIELGTSSEALGEMGHMDMLTRFFRNTQQNASHRVMRSYAGKGEPQKLWRFKGHAEIPFWKWVCSWARACRRPSDLGFDDDGFILPPIRETQHVVAARQPRPDMLFDLPAVGLHEQREERRRTITERCEHVAELVKDTDASLVWCHLNAEGDLLEKIIPDAQQVSGSDSDDEKEAKLMAFAKGELRVLVTKPKIGAWGLNLQHCAHVTFFPSHSYEQFYQGVRRCWRFGQKRQVVVELVSTEGERDVLANLQRKAEQASRMFDALVQHMNQAQQIRVYRGAELDTEVPAWL